MKTKYYIDMDGVLAKWNAEASAEDTFEKGYFLTREPDEKAIRYVQGLLDTGKDVCILSHAYQNGYAEPEKQAWLQEYGLGDVPAIFVPYGTPKLEYVRLPVDTLNILVDDFTKNLREWEAGKNCQGIKYYNGINGTHGTWRGRCINPELNPYTKEKWHDTRVEEVGWQWARKIDERTYFYIERDTDGYFVYDTDVTEFPPLNKKPFKCWDDARRYADNAIEELLNENPELDDDLEL